MDIWKKIKALIKNRSVSRFLRPRNPLGFLGFKKEDEFVEFDQFKEENLAKSHFYQLEKYKKRP